MSGWAATPPAAMARFEVVVENSNQLVGKVTNAFNLHIRKSK